MTDTERELLSTHELSPATVLLFDSHDVARRNTRQALEASGLSRIREVSTSRELRHRLDERQHDLLVMASTHGDDGVADLLLALRRHYFGPDPFAPVVATIASKDDRLVQRIAFSGVDHIIGKPFSGEQVRRRLEALVDRRHRFIETLDYLGPDRRTATARSGSDEAIVVPNALKARVTRSIEFAPSAENIATAKSALARLRTRNIGRRIAAAVKSMGRTKATGAEDWDVQFAMLCRCLDALGGTSAIAEGRGVADAIDALRRAALRFRDEEREDRAPAHQEMIARAKLLLDVLQKTLARSG